VEFRILGPLEVADDGRVVAVPGGKPRALLATLCLSPGETVSAERLIDELWGEEPPETAANALQVHVSQLRKALGADVVVRRGAGYELAVAPEAVDLGRFARLVAEARAAEPAGAERLLREALGLWRGDPEVDRARLEELRLGALEARIDADLALGRHAELVPELEALAAEHPLRERLRGQLMLALYRAGRQADALEVYRQTRETLVDQLGIDPSPELQELERSILTQDATLATPAAAPRFSLPTPPTTLVGRARELADAAALVEQGARLVTLTGPGGIGKTRLGLEVARTLAPRFADGAAFVPLTPIVDPTLVGATIAQALDVTPAADDALLAFARGRELLLLLDNFEQLVDAAPLLTRLLEASPRLVLLVTSQALLRIGGEYEFSVPPLGDDAFELFVERAREVELTDANQQAIRDLCARLEGLPLAIELAAARARLLPPPALLARLTSRLEVLTSGARDAPERQRTMRAAIDWSYRLLNPDEQVLFARLGVFVGGAPLDAVEAVCGDVATLDALQSLLDNSLLRRRDGDEPRFAMLETLREYALEQLAASGEEEAIRRRHVEHFRALLDEAWVPLTGPEQGVWLERLEREHANLRAAVAFAFESGDVETAFELAAGLRRFWYVHGHAEEGLRVYESLLARADAASPLARNKVLNGAAMLASDRGDHARARVFLEESLALAQELGDEHRLGVAYSNLGNIALYEERFDDARVLYERALDFYRAVGGVRDVSIALENLGIATASAGDVEQGIEMVKQAIEHARNRKAPREVATASVDLAWLLLEQDDPESAAPILADARATFEEVGDRAKLADAVEASAGVEIARGHVPEAMLLIDEAAAIRRSIGNVVAPDQARFLRRALARISTTNSQD
jgi:predicted ATPase/DNA-binding SARP family transcriptional activator